MAAALSLGQRLLTLDETIDAWLAGARFMMTGLVLLVLAWAIADVADGPADGALSDQRAG